MKSNGLGFASEIVRPPVRAADIEVGPLPTASEGVFARCLPRGEWCGVSRSGMLCVCLTTLLVAAGVGVGVGFALTEA